jgi:hypothetical protein
MENEVKEQVLICILKYLFILELKKYPNNGYLQKKSRIDND